MAEDRPAQTLAQAIEEYLDWQALDRGRSPNTVRAYGTDLAGFRALAGAAGVEQLGDVDRDLRPGRSPWAPSQHLDLEVE